MKATVSEQRLFRPFKALLGQPPCGKERTNEAIPFGQNQAGQALNWPHVFCRRAHSLFAMNKLRFSYGWVVLSGGLLIWFLAVGMWYSFGVFFKPVAEDFGWNRASTSLGIAIAQLTNGLLSPLSGFLSDRYGPRVTSLASGVFFALGYGLLSQTHTLWQFYLFYFLVGLGMTMNYIPIVSAVSRWFPQKRGLALGITGAGAGVGQAVIPPLATYLVHNYGWSQAYIVLGIPMGLLVMAFALLLKRAPTPDEGKSKSQVSLKLSFSLRSSLLTPAFWIILATHFLINFNLMIVMMHLVNYATDPERGLSPTIAASFLGVIGLANILGKVSLGTLSDRIGRRTSLIITFGLGMMAMLWLNVATDPWMFYIFAAVFGFAYGGWVPIFPALVGDYFGMAALGTIMGAIQMGGPTGSATGSFMAGRIYDLTHSYQLAFMLAAGLFVLGSLLIALVRRPEKEYPSLSEEMHVQPH